MFQHEVWKFTIKFAHKLIDDTTCTRKSNVVINANSYIF